MRPLNGIVASSGLLSLAFCFLLATCGSPRAETQSSPLSARDLEFFEKEVRPVLVERCYECHADKKQKGGLRLDSREAVLKGGDTGPAIDPGNPAKSRLIKAVLYDDPELQMPPKNKLSEKEIRILTEWVERGAPDPRVAAASSTKIPSLEGGRLFWAYQLPKSISPPEVKDSNWGGTEIDQFILAKLEAAGLKPAPPASPDVLLRRLYFDLIGLPPTPAELNEFAGDPHPSALSASPREPLPTSKEDRVVPQGWDSGKWARVVDQLLARREFAERWARHWLDVARYAESVTLRGLVFNEAWRYRDYVIDAFHRDLPFNHFVLEQVAGDLLPSDSLEQRQRRMTATTFLALGNTNLEEQDKRQLRMDVVDEQLDVIGKAFLGQTIGCARCHDHKFDPIPTRDYYAMAGILRNAEALIDANVSNWIELPLPLDPQEEEKFKNLESKIARLQEEVKSAKALLASFNKKKNKGDGPAIVAAAELAGVVLDDAMARRVGEWQVSQYNKPYIGDGYLHDKNEGKGTKTLTFQPELPKPGPYEVRLAYSPGANRAAKVPVTIFSADGEKIVHIDQRETPPVEGRFVALGTYRFEQNGAGFVLISTEGTEGHVIADAVQFLPADKIEVAARNDSESPKDAANPAENGAAKASNRVKELESELKALQSQASRRPKVMTVREVEKPADTYVHLRGSVHNRGELVPRGFLQVAYHGDIPPISETESGRRQLGEWLASPRNPLTARVMVNRIWHWLFGAGAVRTTDNFGSTGEPPSHPELLDYLAVRFMEEGWSVKKMIRLITLSQVYQLSSLASAEAQAKDPENRLLSHQNRRRLEAEAIRDSILAVSGELKPFPGGRSFPAGLAADYGFTHTNQSRSIYLPVFRNALPEILEAFDFADPSMVTGRRNNSTIAPQALLMLNHPFVHQQAERAASRVRSESPLDQAKQIEHAYRMTLGRFPSESEKRIALGHLRAAGSGQDELKAWTEIFHALFASLDFRYLD